MKQESIPPYLGIVGDKKWSPFLDLAIAQIKSLKSSNGCFGLLIHKGTGCEVGRAQKNIFGFSGHPTVNAFIQCAGGTKTSLYAKCCQCLSTFEYAVVAIF